MQNYTNEDGRSMVEMLGVLAVIGVLSIGGIQGYTYAMNKYRANGILNELNIASHQLATVLLTKETAELELSLGNPYDLGRMSSAEYAFNYGCGNGLSEEDCGIDETGYWITISGIPDNICNQMLSMGEHMPYLAERELNGNIIANGVTCAEENNEITFLFNSDGSGKLSEGTGGNGDGNNNENGGNNASDNADNVPEEPDPMCGKNGKWNATLNKCICNKDYVGELCDKSLTDSCIENGGSWVFWTGKFCQCSYGYGGLDCSIAPENTCNGHGYWTNCGMACNCSEGWTGSYCDKQIDTSKYCNGHGSPDYYGLCNCENGYGGANCEIKNPCKNGGAWVNSEWRKSGCDCPAGYTGETCEETLTCKNGGTYKTDRNYVGNIYTQTSYCSCPSGFGGKDCSQNVYDVCENGNWYNGGTHSYCSCNQGWAGDKCDIKIEDYPCVYGNATAQHCYCESGYAGKDCSKLESEYCKNGGYWHVKSETCICENGWMGENCDIPISQN